MLCFNMSSSRRPARPPLRLALYLSTMGLVRGGLETIATELARGIAARGHDVTVVGGYWPGRPLAADLLAIPVTWLRLPCLAADWPVWQKVAGHRPGALLKWQSRSYNAACRLSRRARRLIDSADVTLAFLDFETVHVGCWRAGLNRAHISYFSGVMDWRRLQRDCATARVAISQTIAGHFHNMPAFAVDGVVTPGAPGAWLARPFEVRPLATNLLFIGRLEANKGIWELLSMMGRLASERPEMQLRVAGDGPLRPAVASQILKQGLDSNVTLCGSLDAPQIYNELRQADLLLFPSRYESFGIAALEAQAVGVPVVCSDLPALREATGGAAVFAAAEDVDAWFAAVAALAADGAVRRRLSEAGRKHARRLTWNQAAREFEDYLYLALARSSGDRLAKAPE